MVKMRQQIHYKNRSPFINTTDADSWISNNVENHEQEDKITLCGSFCCLLRITQIGFLLVLLYSFGFLIKGLLFIPNLHKNSSLNPIEELNRPDLPILTILDRSHLVEPPPSVLLDIENFHLLREPQKGLCQVDDLLFIIVVHSKPDHFRQRQAIRGTWGSLKKLTDADGKIWSTRTVFVLGQANEPFHPSGIGPTTPELLDKESEHFDDIVIGSFQDKYKNLRYKNILGLRWAVNQCSNAAFILKSDDDAFVDILSLHQYLMRTFESLNQRNVLAGNVFPDGAPTQRTGKWAVSTHEYPWRQYPSYLGGLAYLMTPDVARDLYRAAYLNEIPQVWVDDVWVTGLLAHSLALRPLFLNPRYSYDHQEMVRWLQKVTLSSDHSHKPPFTFAHLDPSENDWKDTLESLWSHVLKFYGVTSDKGENTFKTHFSLSDGVR